MTDKEKLEKIKKLADSMYLAAQYLTTDASRLRKAMDEYHQFIINEYHKKESINEDLNKEIDNYCLSHEVISIVEQDYVKDVAQHFVQWQKEELLKNAIKATAHPDDCELWCDLSKTDLQELQKVTLVIIK